ncbi:hypothetical protein RUM43_005935 [Polyplax serrata]|uniref:Uncharacterized protein n=1 Tax=Polyplax serrata TaxID=468196 RepID=A0AAN8PAB6_POLSC
MSDRNKGSLEFSSVLMKKLVQNLTIGHLDWVVVLTLEEQKKSFTKEREKDPDSLGPLTQKRELHTVQMEAILAAGAAG